MSAVSGVAEGAGAGVDVEPRQPSEPSASAPNALAASTRHVCERLII